MTRANNDLDVLQLLSLPVSVFIEAKKGNNPRKLYVVFDQTRPIITKKNNAFSTHMAASKPSKAFPNYNFTVDAVAEFQVGYKNVRNKENNCKLCNIVARKAIN